jgi:hypothetical protein
LIKAVVFFWLIGALVTSESRLRLFAWMLSLCSLPLAITAINNYRHGVFVTLEGSAVQRIAGYMGGSGLAGNPNDLALMLNLLMPITGALCVMSRSAWAKVATGLACLLSVAAVIATFSARGIHHAGRDRRTDAADDGPSGRRHHGIGRRLPFGCDARSDANEVLRAALDDYRHRSRPDRLGARTLG